MNKWILYILFLLFSYEANSQEFGFVNNITTNGQTFSKAIKIDNNGDYVACGGYIGGISFDGTVLPGTGSFNSFLSKHDKDGNLLWVVPGYGNGNSEAYDVAVDNNNNIYVTGYFRNNIDFNGITDSSPNEQNSYVAKFDSNGNIIWFEKFGSTVRNETYAIDVDSEGSIYLAGLFRGTTEFVTTTLISTTDPDSFILKLDPNGNEVWIRAGEGSSSSTGRAIDIDANDNVYLFGEFRNDLDYGGGQLVSAGGSDLFLIKFDKNGNIIYQFRDGTGVSEVAVKIKLDNQNNIYLTGWINGNTTFGTINVSATGNTSVILKYNSSATIQWANSIGADGSDFPRDLVLDNQTNVYVGGTFAGTLVSINPSIVSSGSSDLYISKFDSDGNYDWTLTATGGAATNETVYGLAVDSFNTLFVIGDISGTVDFSGIIINSGSNTNTFIANAFELVSIGVNTVNVATDGPFKATLNGKIDSEGNSAVTNRGFVWDFNPSPTIALNTKSSNGSGAGSFSESLIGLLPGTIYYFRAYATNTQGTTYGQEIDFITSSYEIPIDGNQDNIKDTEQNFVHTFLSSNGTNYITIVAPTNVTINEVSNRIQSEDSDYDYPFGITEFKINASQAEVKIYYHGIDSLDSYIYRKLFPNNTYKQFNNVTYSTEIIGGNQVAVATLLLFDGGAGDYDGIVNGVIYDPGGPAILSSSIPTLSEWARIILVGIMILFGGIFIYKRSLT